MLSGSAPPVSPSLSPFLRQGSPHLWADWECIHLSEVSTHPGAMLALLLTSAALAWPRPWSLPRRAPLWPLPTPCLPPSRSLHASQRDLTEARGRFVWSLLSCFQLHDPCPFALRTKPRLPMMVLELISVLFIPPAAAPPARGPSGPPSHLACGLCRRWVHCLAHLAPSQPAALSLGVTFSG